MMKDLEMIHLAAVFFLNMCGMLTLLAYMIFKDIQEK